jgi:hypothetical protein
MSVLEDFEFVKNISGMSVNETATQNTQTLHEKFK